MIRTVINLSRGLGKTTEIVKLVKENKGVLLVHNEAGAKHLRQRYDLKNDQVVSWRRFPEWKIGRKYGPVYIDNADCLLQEIVNSTIEGITLSGPSIEDIRFGDYRFPVKEEEPVKNMLMVVNSEIGDALKDLHDALAKRPSGRAPFILSNRKRNKKRK